MADAGIELTGFDACIDSNLPAGSGLSSSAALEAAAALAALQLSGQTMDRYKVAKICQQAEHVYGGVACGMMDQTAVLCCERNHLLLFDTELETFENVTFDAPEWAWMVINSGVTHELASSEYTERRKCCEAAAKVLGVSTLRHIELADLPTALANEGLNEEMRRLVRHVVTEIDRTRRLVTALGETQMEAVGELLNAGHASLRDDYRVSCPELDFIAATAQTLEGVSGCRMTGGGFGGSCVALVKKDAVASVSESLTKAYSEHCGITATIFVTDPEAAAAVHLL
jgi:galactokinase